MTFSRRRVAALAAVAALCMSTASAHEDKHGASASHLSTAQAKSFGQPGIGKNVTRTIAITLSDGMRFNPAKLAVKQGETIRLRITNIGKIPHEFVLGTRDELAEHAQMMRQMPGMTHNDASSVQVAPGKTTDVVWQFSEAGNFLFACLIPGHREAGMEGSVTVARRNKR